MEFENTIGLETHVQLKTRTKMFCGCLLKTGCEPNTNVCPSLHVIGSMAAFFAFWYAPVFSAKKWRIASAIAAFLICISTVFMKQHSVLDVLAALPLCAIAYYFAYRKPSKRARSASGSLSR